MQRKLCGFPHRANKQQDADQCEHGPVLARQNADGVIHQTGCLREHCCVIQRTKIRQHQADAEQETEIAHAVDQEGFQVGVNRRGARMPEADQQVGHQPHRLPAEKQLQKIIRHHQHQHGKSEQRDVAEKALVAWVFVHVPNGVDVHHQRYESHHQHHHGGERINQETDFKTHIPGRHPGVNRAVEDVSGLHVLKNHPRRPARNGHTGDGHQMRQGAANCPAEQPGNQRTGQWCQRHQKIKFLHFCHGCFPSVRYRVR